ncbi:MAG TPA: hypothetical protein VM285_04850 [Polyangia bacterium]|nr:hypothetical protein [Polyangia bacterium]
MLIVSYYTPGYSGHAAVLEASCDAYGYHHEILGCPDRGDWQANERLKTSFLIGRRFQHPRERLLWVDADGEMMAPAAGNFDPPEPCDIGVHHHHLDRLASPGTLLVEPTDAAWRFLCVWNEQTSVIGDDKASFAAAVALVPGLRVWRLPESHCFIRDLAADPCGPVVVEHHQASREMRRKERAR